MLVLNRKINEALIINDNIEIKILEITSSAVKIGIEAPAEIKILRQELIEEAKNNNMAAKIDLKQLDFNKILKNLEKS